jgi:hypothetical protein
MMKFNQPVQTYDVALTLRGEHGTFLVQRGGQSAIVVAAEGHSIKSWTPVGSIEAVTLSPGTNLPYTCTKIDLEGEDNENSNAGRNRN